MLIPSILLICCDATHRVIQKTSKYIFYSRIPDMKYIDSFFSNFNVLLKNLVVSQSLI